MDPATSLDDGIEYEPYKDALLDTPIPKGNLIELHEGEEIYRFDVESLAQAVEKSGPISPYTRKELPGAILVRIKEWQERHQVIVRITGETKTLGELTLQKNDLLGDFLIKVIRLVAQHEKASVRTVALQLNISYRFPEGKWNVYQENLSKVFREILERDQAISKNRVNLLVKTTTNQERITERACQWTEFTQNRDELFWLREAATLYLIDPTRAEREMSETQQEPFLSDSSGTGIFLGLLAEFLEIEPPRFLENPRTAPRFSENPRNVHRTAPRYTREQLMQAVAAQDRQLISSYLGGQTSSRSGGQTSSRSGGQSNFSPDLLAEAARLGHLMTFKIILEYYTPSDSELQAALFMACTKGHTSLVKYLLMFSIVTPQNSHLRMAVTQGRCEIVSLLLENDNIQPNHDDDACLRMACYDGNLRMIKTLLNYQGPHTPSLMSGDYWGFRKACRNGHLKVVEFLLTRRVNPAAKDNYALRYAAQNGHHEILEILLKLAQTDCTVKDNQALRWAAENGHVRCVKLLLQYGANGNADDYYCLRTACQIGYVLIVKVLLGEKKIRKWAISNRKLLRDLATEHPNVREVLSSELRK